MSRPTAVTLGAAIFLPLLAVSCTSPQHTTVARAEVRDVKPTPIVRALPAPSHRASRSRRVVLSRPMDADTYRIPVGMPALLLRIRSCESGDSYTAANPASTASGAYQVLDSTWGGYGGYSRSKYAPRSVQDAFALRLFREQGSAPWAASAGCWSR